MNKNFITHGEQMQNALTTSGMLNNKKYIFAGMYKQKYAFSNIHAIINPQVKHAVDAETTIGCTMNPQQYNICLKLNIVMERNLFDCRLGPVWAWGRVSEWVIKFNGLSKIAASEVHVIDISRVIITYTL